MLAKSGTLRPAIHSGRFSSRCLRLNALLPCAGHWRDVFGQPGASILGVGLDPVNRCRRGNSMFWPIKNVTFFHSKLLLDNSASFTSSRMKDLCVENRRWNLIFWGVYRLSETGIVECFEIIDVRCNLKQFDGLTWLTLTPWFYDRSTPLVAWCLWASELCWETWPGEVFCVSRLQDLTPASGSLHFQRTRCSTSSSVTYAFRESVSSSNAVCSAVFQRPRFRLSTPYYARP